MTKNLSRRLFLHLLGGALGGVALNSGCQGQPEEEIAEDPLYVDDGIGWPAYRGPYLQRDARIAAFLLPADDRKLKALCDRRLNAPSDSEVAYAPLAPQVFMLLADMAISSLDERDRSLGWTRETELSFWIPVVAQRATGGLLVPDHPAWFLPYLFADNPFAIATGREVYGFPKMLARFDRPADHRRPEFSVSAWGAQDMGAGVEGRVRPLLDVHRTSQESAVEAGEWTTWDELESGVLEMALGDNEDPALALDELEMPLVFLKQFRSASDTRRACYQAIIEAPVRVRQYHAGGPLSDLYHITFHAMESLPIAETLGIPVDETGRIGALAGAWVHVDFSLEAGGEVWRA